jgi:predicted GNAT family acetyltransferase
VGELSYLDNPIWNALNSIHDPLALVHGLAARYPKDVSPLAGLQAATPKAFVDLAHLVPISTDIALFTTTPPAVPANWTVMRSRWVDQMICEQVGPTRRIALLELRQEDMPDMLALAAATEPGPFSESTIRMGRYKGVRSADGRLMAMAGERLQLEGFTEISAVCTASEFRGQGLGRALVETFSSMLLSEGRTPFLHVKTENGAKQLYERIGFRVRSQIRLTVISRSS